MRSDKKSKRGRLASLLHTKPHICAFFNHPDEEYQTLAPFIKEGLDCGEKAFHTVDPRRQKDHLRQLVSAGIDVAAARQSGQLELRPWTEVHLRHGHFNQSKTLALYKQIVENSKKQGFPRIRFVTHMEWALESRARVQDLLEYEARANESWLKPDGPVNPVICSYDFTKFGIETVLNIMRTHPVIIIGGLLKENPFFVPPKTFLKELHEKRVGRGPQAILVKLKRRYERLTPREREVLAHVIEGKLNKQTAAALGTRPITVQVHRGRIMRKMEAPSFADLVRMAEMLDVRNVRSGRYIKT